MRAIVVVANAVREVPGAPGVNVVSNNDAAAGQEVFHLHFHIIPRFEKREFHPLPQTTYTDAAERAAFAKKIADTL